MKFPKLASRKFALTILYLLVVVLNKKIGLGLTEDELNQVFYAIVTFLGVQGSIDFIDRMKNGKP